MTIEELRQAHRDYSGAKQRDPFARPFKPGRLAYASGLSLVRPEVEMVHGARAVIARAQDMAAKRGWSKAELARRACVTPACLVQGSSKDRTSRATVDSLAVALGVNASRLLKCEESDD